MAGATSAVKLEDDVLRKFYRSFHKHGPGNWAKMAKDTKISVEQCEMLHKQHMSFLSLPSSPALETAFLALVNDHYNATANSVKDEMPEDDAPRGGRAARREPEEPEAHVATSSSQKPKRTPKPTPQRLAAEEEMQARRLARANQGTPKSARAKMMAKAPPSPPAGEWTSSQRKRSRRLFEDAAEPEAQRYRSPVIDRWRGRHNTDVDEGVDALLSLASGAHAASTVEEHPSAEDGAVVNAEVDEETDAQEVEHVQATPKRARGGRGGRSTPTPTGTPVKGVGRASVPPASAASEVAAPGAVGMRSPRGRGAAVASGRGVGAAGGRPKKDVRASPTSSLQRGEDGVDASGPGGGEVSDADGANGVAGAEDGADTAKDAAAEVKHEDAAAAAGPVNAAGRPVRKRKPTAIALAAAAAAEEEEGAHSGRGPRGVVAAIAAAVAATGASLPESGHAGELVVSGSGDSGLGSQVVDLLSNTAALLAGVPPVRTRASARIAERGPGSRRAAERPSPPAALQPADGAEAEAHQLGENEEGLAERGAEDGVGQEAGARSVVDVKSEPEGGADGASTPVEEPVQAADAQPPSSGRGRGKAGGAGGGRHGGGRSANQPPPGRRRKRKSMPERLPPLFESLKVTPAQQGIGNGGPSSSGAAAAANSSGEGAPAPTDELAADGVAAAAGPSGAAPAGAPSVPAAELALRHCLGPRMRRWCMYEFFYSALDRPWFLRNELLEFCMHLQLPTTKLTRAEWAVLRAALGRPRRLSLAFLREERLRLEGYRENTRLKYDEVALGMEVPPELPRQLPVGQEVTARHPVSRQLHDGVILTVKGSKYRVQFHRGDLMTEVVRDTELMPLDPHECMPLHMPIVPPLLNGRPYDPMRLASLRGILPGMLLPAMGFRPIGAWSTGLDAQMMREQDAALLLEVQGALERKEGLVAQLTQLNNEAASGLHTDENGACSENFQLQYTKVVLQLKETNAALEGAMGRLQGRQQQVMAGAAIPFGAVLALQQQQHAALAGPGAGPGQAPSSAGAGVATAAPVHSGAAAQSAPASSTGGGAAAPPSTAPSPPLPAPPSAAAVPAPPPSPTASAGAAAGGLPPQPPAASTSTSAAQQPQPTRSGPSKGTAQGPPSSPGAPLVVPPPRPSASAATSASALPPLYPSLAQQQQQQPLGGGPTFPPPLLSPEQIVEHAFVEARSVVDSCRGRYGDGAAASQPLTMLGPPPSALAVPVIAPIVAMQMQPMGGAPVPLILPPGTVLPQAGTLPPLAAEPHQAQTRLQSSLSNTQGQLQQLAGAAASAVAEGGEGVLDGGSSGLVSGPGGGGTRDGSGGDAAAVRIKVEEELAQPGPGAEGAAAAERAAVARVQDGRELSEDQLTESWLRDVIMGCVGVLFTIQKCTAGNVPGATVADALDLAVKQLRIRTEGENDGLYRDIVQSVQGLKGHLTRALA